MAVALFTLWVNRTDRATKLTRQNVQDMLQNSQLMRAMRNDVWAWERWGHEVQLHLEERDRRDRGIEDVFDEMQRELQASGAITHVRSLPPKPQRAVPPMPESELKKVESDIAKDQSDD